MARKLKKLTKSEIAYLAGFLDGEGCISVGAYRTQSTSATRYVRVTVSIGQISVGLPILEKFKKYFGGVIHFRKSKRETWQDHYLYYVRQNGLRVLLKTLLPHLVIKREQALLALRIIELPTDSRLKLAKKFVDLKTGSIKANSILAEYKKQFNAG